jgi:hypothetical protein
LLDQIARRPDSFETVRETAINCFDIDAWQRMWIKTCDQDTSDSHIDSV